MKFISFLVICFCCLHSTAQTIQGIVTDKTTGKPLQSISVFFDNTTTATTTTADGTFEIKIPLNNRNPLIVSAVGYYYFIDSHPSAGFLKIELSPEDTLLEEIIIDKNVFTRKQMLQAFRYFFIGNTKNAKRTKILNENDLFFYFDTKNNTFSAYADKPIVINNENLGYTINFHLDTFQVQFNYQTLEPKNYINSTFFGYSQFIETSNPKNKIIKNRKDTYKNSSAYFFKNLALNNLESSDFVLVVKGFGVNPETYFKIHPENDAYKLCVFKKPTRKKPDLSGVIIKQGTLKSSTLKDTTEIEVPFVVYNKKTKEQSNMYFQQDCTQVTENGHLLKPTDVLFSGFFADLKMADMLPSDFTVAIEEKKPNKTKPVKEMPTYDDFEKEAIAFYSSKNVIAYKKAQKAFFDKLKVEYDYKIHEPFPLWIEDNLKSTLFTSEEEAKTLHNNFVETFKLIKDQKEDIEEKEDHFRKLYGEKEFGKMYYSKIIQGILNEGMNSREEN